MNLIGINLRVEILWFLLWALLSVFRFLFFLAQVVRAGFALSI